MIVVNNFILDLKSLSVFLFAVMISLNELRFFANYIYQNDSNDIPSDSAKNIDGGFEEVCI